MYAVQRNVQSLFGKRIALKNKMPNFMLHSYRQHLSVEVYATGNFYFITRKLARLISIVRIVQAHLASLWLPYLDRPIVGGREEML
jgi:hypothetical protein